MPPAGTKSELLPHVDFVGVRNLLDAAAQRAGRNPAEVRLIAVSKTHGADKIKAAKAAGATDFGENRVQEAENKIVELGRDYAAWHLIGHLQANKARKAVRLFDYIHSLDSLELAERLERVCGEEDRARLPVFAQVDLAGEATKTGMAESDLSELLEFAAQAERLQLVGLLTVPPFFENTEDVRPYFRRLRELRDEWQLRGAFAGSTGWLSMGMTHDYEIAIQEGATHVRIGTAIFGKR